MIVIFTNRQRRFTKNWDPQVFFFFDVFCFSKKKRPEVQLLFKRRCQFIKKILVKIVIEKKVIKTFVLKEYSSDIPINIIIRNHGIWKKTDLKYSNLFLLKFLFCFS